MLSSIGRAAIKRIGVRPVRGALKSSWTASNTESNAASRTYLANSLRRLYATATKATQTTKTIKKINSAKTAPAKPKKPAAKKPVKKLVKKPAKKVVKKKVIKKKVVAKPKIKKAAKEKTPEQLQRLARSVELAKIRAVKQKLSDLKKTALIEGQPQSGKHISAWVIYMKETLTGYSGNLLEGSKKAKDTYKSLEPAEHERLNQLARKTAEQRANAYKSWIATHTPDQIRLANNARSQLKRKLSKGQSAKVHPLVDDRIPKKPVTAFALFVKERYASGDLKGISVPASARLLRGEWAALSPGAQKPYHDASAAERLRYAQEFETVFHRPTYTDALKQKAANA